MILKRCHWLRGVRGNGIDEYFNFKNGGAGCLSAEWDETQFNVFVVKEPDYNEIIMSTFLGFNVTEVQNQEIIIVNKEVVKLKYTELFC